MKFYLGTHEPAWMRRVDVPLFVSTRRLARRKSLPIASCDWALDSGGFSELSLYGQWETSAGEYAAYVRRYAREIGRMDWAAPQDWMCEPFMLEKTGLTVRDHQRLTIDSVVDLRARVGGAAHIVPVLQGWAVGDYLDHVEMYERRGFNLSAEPVVGVGSVCRRQALGEAESLVMKLAAGGLRLHGFGMKGAAIARYGSLLKSCDSMAWSYAGRRRPDPSCGKSSCANCMHYAMSWRDEALRPQGQLALWGARCPDSTGAAA